MLRAVRLPPILTQITGDGLHTSLLLTWTGDLLASSSSPPLSRTQLGNVGAIVSNISNELDRAGGKVGGGVHVILIDIDGGRIAVAVCGGEGEVESSSTNSVNSPSPASNNGSNTNHNNDEDSPGRYFVVAIGAAKTPKGLMKSRVER